MRNMARIADRVRVAGEAARNRVQAGGATIRDRVTATAHSLRKRWRWFDHLAEAYGLYQDKRGGSLAGATTFFGFLSFFPLVALAYSIGGYAASVSPQARDWLRNGIQSVLPGLAHQLELQSIADARVGTGIAGLLTAVLCALGLCLLVSAAASALAVPAATAVLGWAGFAGSLGAEFLIRLLAIAVAVIFDGVMFALIFSRLSGTKVPRQRLLPGALVGAIGFEALKLIGVYLVARTTHNPVYASFAVMVGLLVWINLVARLTFLTAAWTATSQR